MLAFSEVDGDFITLKGLKAQEELQEAKRGIEKLGGEVMKQESFTLTDENDHRCNIYIHKVKNTPFKYPRDLVESKETIITHQLMRFFVYDDLISFYIIKISFISYKAD